MARLLDSTGTQLTLSQAASAPGHCVRKQEWDAFNSGVSRTGHTHVTADITDLPAAVAQLWANVVVDSGTLHWALAGGLISGVVRVRTGGGIRAGADGLYLDTTLVSQPGHTHVLADLTNFSAQLPALVAAVVVNSPTIAWQFDGSHLSGVVVLKTAGGLLKDGNGVAVDFGASHTQAAFGDHTHAQLHDPVTLAPSTSLTLSLAGQQLTAAVTILAGSGLWIDLQSGVRVDFGTSHTQAAYGDHTHALLHNPVAVVQTSSLTLGIDGAQNLSGVVRVDPAPPGGSAPLTLGVNGLYVQLGAGANQPAAGNHIHAIATEAADGFLSAADKLRLDTMYGQLIVSGVVTSVGSTATIALSLAAGVISGLVRIKPWATLTTNQGELNADTNGLFVVLGTGANTAAAGNHTHAAPTGTGFRHVTAGAEDGAARLVVNADVDPAAAVAEAKLALNFATHSNTNDPTTAQKAALAGSANAPGGANPYCTLTDSRLLTEVVRLTLDGYGSPLTTGVKDFWVAPYSGVVNGWDIIGNHSGILTVDILRSNYASFPPTLSMAGSELPGLSNQQINQDLHLTTWTGGGAFSPNDCLCAVTTYADGVIKRAQVQLRITKV